MREKVYSQDNHVSVWRFDKGSASDLGKSTSFFKVKQMKKKPRVCLFLSTTQIVYICLIFCCDTSCFSDFLRATSNKDCFPDFWANMLNNVVRQEVR